MLRISRNSLRIFRRSYATHLKVSNRTESPVASVLKLNVGDTLNGYTIKQVDEVPELQLAAVLLDHDKTGAQHLHVAREDKNNLFSVALRTTPCDSKGIMHILEHLALCGSRRYPARDPFMKMQNRSLATFMNAYTGPDYTMYLYSTQNSKDFENLLNVYADAVFFPQLQYENFRQEGWRLEHQDVNDPNSPIVLKGVVFNEMKGVFSDPNQLYGRCMLNKLYPTSYCHESGGDPLEIPNLTCSELHRYHEQYYHPSNSRFFTYGDQPLEAHLQSIQECVLNKFGKIDIRSDIEEEATWKQPREEFISCRYDPMVAVSENQTTVGCSYLLDNVTKTRENFVMSIIGNLLVDGPNSPFYKSLLEPGIGADYSPWTGYEDSLKRGFFSVGLREIAKKDVEQVKNIIDSTIDDTIKNGFPRERIDGVLHNIELSLKHQSTNFGHHAVMGINSSWNHGGNPITSLKVNNHVQWFQKQLQENPHFLQEKIAQNLKENPHRLCLVMSPDPDYEAKQQEAESKLLNSKLVALTEEAKKEIFAEGMALAKLQDMKEDLSCLPTLHIKDVDREIERTHLQNELFGKVPVQVCEQPTNGITYFSAVSKLSGLPEDLLMLLPIFCEVITKMGAGDSDFKQFDQKAELKTGGLSAIVHLTNHPTNMEDFELGVLFLSHSLQKNVGDMMTLWKDVFNRVTLEDKSRLSQLIKQAASDSAQSIPSLGHKYALLKAASCLNLCENVHEKLSGLTQIAFMKEIADLEDYGEILSKLQTLSGIILNKENLRCSVNANVESMASSLSFVEDFIQSLSDRKADPGLPRQWADFEANQAKYHFVMPFGVNYLGCSMMTVPYNHQDHASLRVAAKLLSSKFLHVEIREKGGAYGAGSALKSNGSFIFYSYRDPHVTETLKSFDAGATWLTAGDNYTDLDIDEAKLGVFGEVDRPVAPGSKGSAQFLCGISDDMRQLFRERLFAVSREDIVSVTNRYLLNAQLRGTSLIGPEHEITANDADWTVHKE